MRRDQVETTLRGGQLPTRSSSPRGVMISTPEFWSACRSRSPDTKTSAWRCDGERDQVVVIGIPAQVRWVGRFAVPLREPAEFGDERLGDRWI